MSGLKILYSMSPTSTTKWPRHPVDFECILSESPWTALFPYFFNIRQNIQRTPGLRLPLSRVWIIPLFLVFAGVQSPCLKQSSIVHTPAVPTAMFLRYSKGSLFWISHPFQGTLSYVDLLCKPVS